MFAYCLNNPVNMSDDSGNWPKASTLFAAVAVTAIAVVALATVTLAVAAIAPAAIAVGGSVISSAAVAAAASTIGTNALVVAAGSTAAAIASSQIEKKHSQSYSVYFLEDSSGRIQYVGRVTDRGYNARMAHHYATRGLTPAYRIPNLSYAEARGLEEIGMIECHTLNVTNPKNNQIHGISTRNKNGERYMKAACNYLSNRAENWVLNLLA